MDGASHTLTLFAFMALLVKASDTQMTYRYVGCFEDRNNEWSFFWWPQRGPGSQSAAVCARLCDAERFSHFGMGGPFGVDCHCGNGGYDIYPPSGECTRCTFLTETFGCGAKDGDNRIISVYQTPSKGSLDQRFIGCWSAGDPKGVLGPNPVTQEENDPGLSLESCLRGCWRRGALYAGIMFASKCYCGSDLQWNGDNRRPVSTSSCDVTCNGNSYHVCGGQSGSVISIYRAAPTEPSKGIYIGCFTDLRDDWVFFWWTEPRLSRYHPASSCVVQCEEQGFLFYGLGGRYGTDCHCGNSNYFRYGPSEDCKECNTLGETFQCGRRYGYFRLLSVYQIPGQNPVDQRYVGCWTADDPVQVLGNSPVKALEDPVRMNIASCVDACVRVGRRYAGLKSGSECHCGNALQWKGSNKKPAPSSSCNARCPGDRNAVCGGTSSQVISIYRAECPNGTYSALGRGCAPCSCDKGAICNVTTGQCPGQCSPGWVSEKSGGPCTTPCPDQKYGMGCQLTCHCYNMQTCDKVSGKCPGPCADGWMIPVGVGDLACSMKGTPTPKEQSDTKKKDIKPIAIGAGVGGFCLLVIIIVICCCKRRREQARIQKRVEEEAEARKLEEARKKRRRRRDS